MQRAANKDGTHQMKTLVLAEGTVQAPQAAASAELLIHKAANPGCWSLSGMLAEELA